MGLEYARNNKGSEFLIANGYIFGNEKMINDKKIWKCTEYHTTKCRSCCHKKCDTITKQPNEHNHVVDNAKVDVKI